MHSLNTMAVLRRTMVHKIHAVEILQSEASGAECFA